MNHFSVLRNLICFFDNRLVVDLTSFLIFRKTKALTIEDPLSNAMDINVLDCRKPFVPFEDFYNEPLSESIEMDTDYLNYKSRKLGKVFFFT